MGIGVAMNNTVLAASSTNVNSVNQTNTNVNNIHLDDVQKLQQQLQDIKEQVSCSALTHPNFLNAGISILLRHIFFSHIPSRRCARYASIE